MSELIRHRPAVMGEWAHRHYRARGIGVVEHSHPVCSAIHGHERDGLGLVRLSWAVWRWTTVGTAAYELFAVVVYLALGLIALLGFWQFALSVNR